MFSYKTSELSQENDTPSYELTEFSDLFLENLIVDLYPFPENVEPTLANLKQELLKKMPKTDDHVHGEAGFLIDEALARELARRNNIDFPEELLGEDALWKYRGNPKFEDFLADFKTVSNLIRTPQDVEDVAYAFYKNCYENNVIYALPGISWYQCKDQMTFDEFNKAYHRALARGLKDFGAVTLLQLRYYMERHLKAEEFDEIFHILLAQPQGLISTIGLAGGEYDNPLEKFACYYQTIKEQRSQKDGNWFFLTAHMEKFSSPETILESLQWLDWIAHGRRLAEDNNAVEKVQEAGCMLELCPLSDVAVYPGEFEKLQDHQQLKTLLEKGLVNLNSDDPSFFGTIDKVYQQVYEKLGVSMASLLHCTWRGIQPASLQSLQEMKEFHPDAYENWMQIQDCGELKIQFFQCYWEMLPQLLGLEDNLIKNLLGIDLKTPYSELQKLKAQVDEKSTAHQFIRKLVFLRYTLDCTTEKILTKMNQAIEQVSTFTPQATCEL